MGGCTEMVSGKMVALGASFSVFGNCALLSLVGRFGGFPLLFGFLGFLLRGLFGFEFESYLECFN